MYKKYLVTLTESERQMLKDLISAGKGAARRLAHARILLKADESPDGPAWTDDAIAAAVELSRPTVERVRQRFVEEGLEAALNPRPPRRTYRRKLDGEQEARLIALSCSAPPAGQVRWTLRLLADKLVELEIVEDISHEAVRQVLKKTSSSPGARKSGSSRPRPVASSSGTWKTSWRSTRAHTTPSGRRSAWTSDRSN